MPKTQRHVVSKGNIIFSFGGPGGGGLLNLTNTPFLNPTPYPEHFKSTLAAVPFFTKPSLRFALPSMDNCLFARHLQGILQGKVKQSFCKEVVQAVLLQGGCASCPFARKYCTFCKSYGCGMVPWLFFQFQSFILALATPCVL